MGQQVWKNIQIPAFNMVCKNVAHMKKSKSNRLLKMKHIYVSNMIN